MGVAMTRGAAGAIAAAIALTLVPAATAATYRPNKGGDPHVNGCTRNSCSLREAVIKANAHAGRDTIVLRGGKTYNLGRGDGGDENTGVTDDLDLLDSVTIKSSDRRLATVDANGVGRIFDVGTGDPANVLLSRLVVKGGHPDGFAGGGGIALSKGSLKVVRSRVTGNRSNDGGGIATRGWQASLKIVKSTISNNRAVTVGIFNGHGGGVDAAEDAVTIRDSTISDNRATGKGGGVSVQYEDFTITNSTIANNAAGEDGGGIWSIGEIEIASVTVARNLAVAGQGGGLFDAGGTFRVANSIIALNDAGDSGPDCRVAGGLHFSTDGANLLGDSQDCTGEGFSDPPDILDVNPKLGLLAKNGGPTETLALKAGSPAINAAGAGTPPRDQRGVKRVNPDIGAYERR